MIFNSQHFITPVKFQFVVILWVGCLTGWLAILTDWEIDMRVWTDCKLFFFLYQTGRHYSSMLLVLMSVEKCFAVYFPLKSKTVCTVGTAKWATGIVGFILEGYNLQWFVVIETRSSRYSGGRSCGTRGDYYLTLKTVDSVLYSFGPFTLMFITNFAIVLQFIKAKYESIQNISTESTNQALAKSATRGTAMVVTVSVTFLVLTIPIALNNALGFKLHFIPAYEAFMNLTQYLNHSINGVLYCIVGSRFRQEFFKLIGL